MLIHRHNILCFVETSKSNFHLRLRCCAFASRIWRTDRPDCDWFHGFTKADGNRETFENRISLNFVVAPALVLTGLIQLIWQLMSLCALSRLLSAPTLSWIGFLPAVHARRRSIARQNKGRSDAPAARRHSLVSGASGRLLRAVDAALS